MKTIMLILVTALLACFQPINNEIQAGEKPRIEIIRVPAYNTFVYAEGNVTGNVDFADFRIACYLYSEEGGGWFNKPYWASPTVGISNSGSFRVNVTTGGTDERATALIFFLVKSDFQPPILRGGKIPSKMLDEMIYLFIGA